MILEGLFSTALALLQAIFTLFPQEYPAVFDTYINIVRQAVSSGVSIVAFYFPEGYLSALLTFLGDFIIIYFSICLVKKIISLVPILDLNVDK